MTTASISFVFFFLVGSSMANLMAIRVCFSGLTKGMLRTTLARCLSFAFPRMLSDISIPTFKAKGRNIKAILLRPQYQWPCMMRLIAVRKSVVISTVGKAAFMVKCASTVLVAFVLL